jgi:hypothetical protein
MLEIRHGSFIRVGVQFLPLTILGTYAAFLAAWLVPRLPPQVIVGIGSICLIACNLLSSLTPRHETYWAMSFPVRSPRVESVVAGDYFSLFVCHTLFVGLRH